MHIWSKTLSRQLAQDAHSEPAAPPADIDQSTADFDEASLETLILNKLDDDKAQDIVCIDLRGKSSVADTLIIASGRSHRHVGALADHVMRALKDAGYGKVRVEGLPACDWVLLDAGDVVVHLFRPEVRSFYNIEKIWSVSSNHMVDSNA
ncbi:ribosome silencing factor [Asticcacaulis sp. AND118]|uniref:ribosome silencing factor n=1 Tax=Asticcacaulis sp. AND118 TaxID=2840468 RepID=UPI00351D66E1